jgi:RNA polymerase sigma-70 factor (ECF subfamily)
MAAEPLGVWGADRGLEGHLRALPTPQSPDFEDLYREHFDRLRRFVLGMTGRESVAEDIAQETLLRAYIRMEKLDLNRPMWPWLKQVATRLVYDHTRGEREVCSEDTDLAVDACADVADQLAERDLVARVLRRLPARQRAAVTLRYLEDWKAAELAELFDLPRPAVEQLLLRARRSLGAEYRRLGADRIRLALWPLVAMLGRWRDRAVRAANSMSSAGGSSVASVMDATTQAMVAVAVSSSLIAGGIAFAHPAADAPQARPVASTRADRDAVDRTPARLAARPTPSAAKAASPTRSTTSTSQVQRLPRARRITVTTPRHSVAGTKTPKGEVDATPKRNRRRDWIIVGQKFRVDVDGRDFEADGQVRVGCKESELEDAACDSYDRADEAAPDLPESPEEATQD